MSNSQGSIEDPQLTKVGMLDSRSPNQRKYSEVREREYLFEHEVEALIEAAKSKPRGRHPHRDATLILVAYRHGLRIWELVNLRWSQVNFSSARLHVNRIKGSRASTHPISGRELRALRKLLRDYPDSSFLFVSERGGPLSTAAARNVIIQAGQLAGLPFPIHPHQLRHSCGYYLAMKGEDTRAIQDYLGHVNIHHTVQYTALSDNRFEKFWED
jgi:type 1 fimbriae regulatory protein FimB/type 1 fimbriae regulatory protein FimE